MFQYCLTCYLSLSLLTSVMQYLVTHFSDFQLATLGTFIIHESVFFLSGLPSLLFERSGFFSKYKIQVCPAAQFFFFSLFLSLSWFIIYTSETLKKLDSEGWFRLWMVMLKCNIIFCFMKHASWSFWSCKLWSWCDKHNVVYFCRRKIILLLRKRGVSYVWSYIMSV